MVAGKCINGFNNTYRPHCYGRHPLVTRLAWGGFGLLGLVADPGLRTRERSECAAMHLDGISDIYTP